MKIDITATGKTVDEALENAKKELGIDVIDDGLKYEIIDLPKKSGFLGLKTVPAKVRVYSDEDELVDVLADIKPAEKKAEQRPERKPAERKPAEKKLAPAHGKEHIRTAPAKEAFANGKPAVTFYNNFFIAPNSDRVIHSILFDAFCNITNVNIFVLSCVFIIGGQFV